MVTAAELLAELDAAADQPSPRRAGLDLRLAELLAVVELVAELTAELVDGLEDPVDVDPDRLEVRLAGIVAELVDSAELVAALLADSRAPVVPQSPRRAAPTQSPAIPHDRTRARTAPDPATPSSGPGSSSTIPGVSQHLAALREECLGVALDWTVGPTAGTLRDDLAELVDSILATLLEHLEPVDGPKDHAQ